VDVSFARNDVLLFGSERRGLPPEVLSQLDERNFVTLPMRAGNRSLNLSNAVAVAVYEAWRQLDFAGAAPGG
jgi:tRNA (cytidine/uridine-2'-O-)-methyltransferase